MQPMTEIDDDELAPEDTGQGPGIPKSKGRRAFRNLTRELDDADLENPAVQRLLIDDY